MATPLASRVFVIYTFILPAAGDFLPGDVNGDGMVNSLDAAQALKFDALIIELSETALTAADVNGDGSVNSLDAAMILKYDAGIIDGF